MCGVAEAGSKLATIFIGGVVSMWHKATAEAHLAVARHPLCSNVEKIAENYNLQVKKISPA